MEAFPAELPHDSGMAELPTLTVAPATSTVDTLVNGGSPVIWHKGTTTLFSERGSVCSMDSLNVKVSSRKSTSSTTRRSLSSLCFELARGVVDSGMFVAITSVITVYALLGDDIRLLSTDRPADIIFDGLTLASITVFSIEMILCTLGKDDYFLSFYFMLDIVSTVTLFLDLSTVNESLVGDEEDLENVRGSRTAKLGARLPRLLRVIRLMRILKLYKAGFMMQKSRKESIRSPGQDAEMWATMDVEELFQHRHSRGESKVSKKLSERTTRRVVCVVLIMMMVLPILRMDASQQFPTSGTYGADLVHEAFLAMEANANVSSYRTTYEQALLQYIYYHNWFTTKMDSCPYNRRCSRDYTSQLFWVGVQAQKPEISRAKARDAKVQEGTVKLFEEKIEQVISNETISWRYNFGTMPEQVRSVMSLSWDAECKTSNAKYTRFGFSLLEKVIPGKVDYAVPCPEDLRRIERGKYTARLNIKPEAYEDWHLAFYFDTRPAAKTESRYSIIITFFVCLLLATASLLFSSDANNLVMYPVENMMEKVETIRANPLNAIKVADEEFKVEELKRVKMRRKPRKFTKCTEYFYKLRDACTARETNELMETVILEKTIIKLGTLLALGFGEAGAQIIRHNLNGDSACVNVMVEGTRVECIIGSARIRDFSIATEVLQGHVMTFVNRIAEIVHGIVNEFHGAANKNTGDTFLLIWRKSEIEEHKVSKLADMAMVAFTRILGAVHCSPRLAVYRGHPGLQQRLGKNCRVNLSSGLHHGWAIEGAVGSEFKIDASYLSPNVSIAESVERATRVYGVSILVAESVMRICSSAMAAKCRLIDRVILPGSISPISLHVIDLDYASLMVETPPMLPISWTSRQRYRVRQFLEAEKAVKWHGEVHMPTLFNESPDICTMRLRYTLEFLHVFNMGFQNYAQGEWEVARRLLTRTQNMLGVEDGPSTALLHFMETPHNFQAPSNWQGIRVLDAGMKDDEVQDAMRDPWTDMAISMIETTM